MSAPSESRPFVFSIRPTYVERILDGHKRWEYRRRRPNVTEGDLILIYETAPLSAIVASARVDRVLSDHMLVIWARTWLDGCGVTAEEFAAYFDGASKAVAMELRGVSRFSAPIPLPPGMGPPQSWARLRIDDGYEHWSLALDSTGLVWS